MTYNILANIHFQLKSKRSSTIKNGYRPLFRISNKASMYSGIIYLTAKELMPGESSDAIIGFFSDEPFSDVAANTMFEFYEGSNLIGSGIIKDFLGWDNLDRKN